MHINPWIIYYIHLHKIKLKAAIAKNFKYWYNGKRYRACSYSEEEALMLKVQVVKGDIFDGIMIALEK